MADSFPDLWEMHYSNDSLSHHVDYASSPRSALSSSPINSRTLFVEFSETKSCFQQSREVLRRIDSCNGLQSIDAITSRVVVEHRKCRLTRTAQRVPTGSKENAPPPPQPENRDQAGGPSSLFTVWEPVLAFR
eukprot:574511-Hanusia_phi.AAC.4